MTESNSVRSVVSDSPNDKGQQTKGDSSSFLNAIFLSPTTLIFMTSLVVVAILIMGGLVLDYASNKNFYDSREMIIKEAKKKHDELEVTKIDIAKNEQENERLSEEAKKIREALSLDEQLRTTEQAKFEQLSVKLQILQEEIAESEAKKDEAFNLADEAEQRKRTIQAQEQQLDANIQAKEREYRELDGEVRAVTQQIKELNLRMSTITNVESDFKKIQDQLSTATTQLETINSSVLISTTNLKSYVTTLSKENQRLSDEVDSLKINSQSIERVADDIDRSSNATKAIAGQLQQTQNSLQASSVSFSALVGQVNQTENSIQTLRKTIESSTASIRNLGSDTQKYSAESNSAFKALNTALGSAQSDLVQLSQLISEMEDSIPDESVPSGNN